MHYDSASADARTSAERSLDTMLLDESLSQASRKADYMGIFQQFVWMGWSAFGGPAAHIGLFQKVYFYQQYMLAYAHLLNMAGTWSQAYAVATLIVLCWRYISNVTSSSMMAEVPSLLPMLCVEEGTAVCDGQKQSRVSATPFKTSTRPFASICVKAKLWQRMQLLS